MTTRRVGSLALFVLVATGALAGDAAACPADAADRAAALRARLDRERGKAFRWRLGWGIGFGAATIAQGALYLTETAPFGDYDEAAEASLAAGTIKSLVGAASRVVSPVKVGHPAVTGDACADLASAQAVLAKAAKGERQSFWVNHVGGLALQAAGTLYIGLSVDDAWGDAAISFAIGYTVGTISTYMQPRGLWKEWRAGERSAVSWQIVPLVAPRSHGLGISGQF